MASAARSKLLDELAADHNTQRDQEKTEALRREADAQIAKQVADAADKAKHEVLREISKAKFEAEANAAHQKQVMAEAAPTQAPKRRGRPKKDSGGPSPYLKAAVGATANLPGGDQPFTDKGKAAKRKVFALKRKLPERLKDYIPSAQQDTDEAWFDALAEAQAILGEASAEVNIKSLFVNALVSYEMVSSQGRLNPLGWDTTDLAKKAQEQWPMFDPDLVELSVLYGDWFATGPFMRLASNTLALIQRTDMENRSHNMHSARQPMTEEEKKEYEGMAL